MKPKKILIIDDDPRNVFALSAYLKTREFVCLSALGCEEGLSILKNEPGIGAVLLDMMMPETDGFQAIHQIRNESVSRKLPIIAVTANAMAGDKEKCLAAGADHYISKPIKIDSLITVLQQYFN